MSEIILVTGGCRSGKSNYAEKLALEAGSNKLYIATAPILDDEMSNRVQKHQKDREGKGWKTIEEEIDLAEVLGECKGYDSILIDCLTLWINNMIYYSEKQNTIITEDTIADKIKIIIENSRLLNTRIIFVINEVGMGIIPDNKVARLFRDLSGRCSQIIAQNADKVVLMSCGIPLTIK